MGRRVPLGGERLIIVILNLLLFVLQFMEVIDILASGPRGRSIAWAAKETLSVTIHCHF